jgi:hypothetical protein
MLFGINTWIKKPLSIELKGMGTTFGQPGFEFHLKVN